MIFLTNSITRGTGVYSHRCIHEVFTPAYFLISRLDYVYITLKFRSRLVFFSPQKITLYLYLTVTFLGRIY